MKKINNKKILIFVVIILVVLTSSVAFADGWVNDGYGNWLYEENGEFVKATWKNIDGVNYYFDTKGYWLETQAQTEYKLSGREVVTFIMEGKDYNDRNYKTKVTIPRPILSGNNAEAINEFIKKEFQNIVTKYYQETKEGILFLTTEIKVGEMMEIYNLRGVVGIGYFGGSMFNLYIDTNKLEMWATSNIN